MVLISEVQNECEVCGGTVFRNVVDAWMKRTFSFVEKAGYLKMCEGCGAKFYVCPQCGYFLTRVHPALTAEEVSQVCKNCGFENPDVRAWDGVSANPNKL